jgi:CubicO group peptidase (beta-lactamase class C family)
MKINIAFYQKNIKLLIKICLLLFLNYSAHAKTVIPQQDSSLNAKISNFLQAHKIPGAAVYIYNNGKEYEYIYGYSDLQAKTPITNKTLFELGSITKTLTGLLLAQMVVMHKVKLSDHLKLASNQSIAQITLLQLATHTSGLPYGITNLPYNCPTTTKNEKILAKFLQDGHLLSTPQSRFLYSNIGFSLLGQDLAVIQSTTYSHLISNYILLPLGMDNTYLTISKNQYTAYSNGYNAKRT